MSKTNNKQRATKNGSHVRRMVLSVLAVAAGVGLLTAVITQGPKMLRYRAASAISATTAAMEEQQSYDYSIELDTVGLDNDIAASISGVWSDLIQKGTIEIDYNSSDRTSAMQIFALVDDTAAYMDTSMLYDVGGDMFFEVLGAEGMTSEDFIGKYSYSDMTKIDFASNAIPTADTDIRWVRAANNLFNTWLLDPAKTQLTDTATGHLNGSLSWNSERLCEAIDFTQDTIDRNYETIANEFTTLVLCMANEYSQTTNPVLQVLGGYLGDAGESFLDNKEATAKGFYAAISARLDALKQFVTDNDISLTLSSDTDDSGTCRLTFSASGRDTSITLKVSCSPDEAVVVNIPEYAENINAHFARYVDDASEVDS